MCWTEAFLTESILFTYDQLCMYRWIENLNQVLFDHSYQNEQRFSIYTDSISQARWPSFLLCIYVFDYMLERKWDSFLSVKMWKSHLTRQYKQFIWNFTWLIIIITNWRIARRDDKLSLIAEKNLSLPIHQYSFAWADSYEFHPDLILYCFMFRWIYFVIFIGLKFDHIRIEHSNQLLFNQRSNFSSPLLFVQVEYFCQ